MRVPDTRAHRAATSGRVSPAIIVAGAITLSVAVFIGYTLPKFLDKPDQDLPKASAETPRASEPDQTTPEIQPPSPTPERPAKPERPELADITPPPLTPSNKPITTVAKLARALRDHPTADALPALEPGTAANEDDLALLQQIFRDAGFELDPDHPPREIGDIDGRTRWEFPLVTTENGITTATSQITIDLVKGTDGRWRIAAITVPDALKNHIAQLTNSTPPNNPGSPTLAATDPGSPTPPSAATKPLDLTDPKTAAATKNDPLGLADAFVQALAAGDFATARALTSPEQISDEKLAALFIVTEDGNFAPRPHRPVVTITHDENSALLVVRLGSPGTPDTPGAELVAAGSTEFGLELNRSTTGKWQVAGVNFSKLIADTAASLRAGDVAYSPIVDNPSGGDSLALYFPFDDDTVHPRAARQLNIIAAILIGDPNKRIKLDGHTDARGTPRYNDTLSRTRAAHVRSTLIELGVPGDQVVMRGFGEAKPAAPNTLPDGTDNPPGRARNRRTEIYLDF